MKEDIITAIVKRDTGDMMKIGRRKINIKKVKRIRKVKKIRRKDLDQGLLIIIRKRKI
jgi:hypothetical protein